MSFSDEKILAVTHLDSKDLNYLKRVVLQLSTIGREDLLNVALYDILGHAGLTTEARTFILMRWKDVLSQLGREYAASEERKRRTLLVLDNAYATLEGDDTILDIKEMVTVSQFPEPAAALVLYLPELFQRVSTACERPADPPPSIRPTPADESS